jgi:hypothetical protein
MSERPIKKTYILLFDPIAESRGSKLRLTDKWKKLIKPMMPGILKPEITNHPAHNFL